MDGRIEDNILAFVPLTERTQAVDILKAFKTIEIRFNLDLTKLVSVCTDGAPAMIGVHGGFVALLKKYVAEKTENCNIISYHCIIHQENLCAEIVEKDCTVLTTVTKVSESSGVDFYCCFFFILINIIFRRSSIKFEPVTFVFVVLNYSRMNWVQSFQVFCISTVCVGSVAVRFSTDFAICLVK